MKKIIIVLTSFFCFSLLYGCIQITTPTNQETTDQETPTTDNPETTDHLTTTEAIDLNMPKLYIRFYSVSEITSDEEYTPCNVTLLSNTETYNFTSLTAGIRLRGNSTQEYDKKPYRIKFDDDIQLLGLGHGPSKSWLLLGEYVDFSMLRNKTAFDFANQLLRHPFVSDTAFVEVYVNNVYQGVYLLAEQTHVNEYRVNIDESAINSPEIIDTGYLLELECDEYRRVLEGAYMEGWFDIPGYSAAQGEIGYWNYHQYTHSSLVSYYIIKSDAKSSQQVQYIRDYMASIYEAIYVTQTQEAVSNLINIESAVDMYILQLITNDVDNNYSSTFVYKDKGGKLIFGPTWDHDLSFGNHLSDTSHETVNMFHLLYDLGHLTWFNTMVKNRWEEISATNGLIDQIIGQIDTYSNIYSHEFQVNHELWMNTRQTGGWHFYYQDGLTSQVDGKEHLKSWLNQRIIFIESYLDQVVE